MDVLFVLVGVLNLFVQFVVLFLNIGLWVQIFVLGVVVVSMFFVFVGGIQVMIWVDVDGFCCEMIDFDDYCGGFVVWSGILFVVLYVVVCIVVEFGIVLDEGVDFVVVVKVVVVVLKLLLILVDLI